MDKAWGTGQRELKADFGMRKADDRSQRELNSEVGMRNAEMYGNGHSAMKITHNGDS